MFSFVGDVVLDPFAGTGTSLLAAAKCQRNSIGTEIDPEYFQLARRRLEAELEGLFGETKLQFEEPANAIPLVAANDSSRAV